MITEAVILAGGFGTRLSHVLGNVPKPMAPVAGKPFLCYLLDRLYDAGFKHIVLATGYKHEVIESYFGNAYRGMQITISNENEPLFTGGAICKAATYIKSDTFVVINGDTLFDIDFDAFAHCHEQSSCPITIALRHVDNANRYGVVDVKQVYNNLIITQFNEKSDNGKSGLINGGIYAIDKQWLMQQIMPVKFSFEKELLQQYAHQELFNSIVFNNYFIDIGVPDDYHRAQGQFRKLFPRDEFLFLDRDGVLNKYIDGGYVCEWADFEWMPNVLTMMPKLANHFRRICVVTNQQGVGKGIFTQETLDDIHSRMLADINKAGGRLDKIYVCTSLASANDPCRKPNIGMALQAHADYPEIDFAKSLLIGDSVSDIQMGYRCRMRTIYLTRGNEVPDQIRNYTDLIYIDLASVEL